MDMYDKIKLLFGDCDLIISFSNKSKKRSKLFEKEKNNHLVL
jgi:hypothetical protein